jgi:hypothetical protein
MAAMNGGNKGNMDGDEQSHFQPRPPVQMSDFTTVGFTATSTNSMPKTRPRNHRPRGQAATIAATGAPVFTLFSSGYIPQDTEPKLFTRILSPAEKHIHK